jgi:hypothetical protein
VGARWRGLVGGALNLGSIFNRNMTQLLKRSTRLLLLPFVDGGSPASTTSLHCGWGTEPGGQ